MGQEHKKMVGNFMGPQEDNQPEKGAAGNGVGTPSFDKGAIMDGLPGLGDRTPDKGYEAPAEFQDIRNQDPKKGTM
jgi:hypothetical protein